METYIAFLRGINVSGKNKILMSDLKTIFKNIGFNDVITYIQSGNVIFKSNMDKKLLDKLITNKIELVYGYKIAVVIRTKEELKYTIDNNPFLVSNKEIDTKKLSVAYLNIIPTELQKFKDFDFGNDQYRIIENKLKVIATTRNWRTTNKVFEIISKN